MHPFEFDDRPSWFDGAYVEMERRFADLAADTPGWPDPHPYGREPAEEEYSRILDPGKYRILERRWEAWAQALAAYRIATTTYVDEPAAWAGTRRAAADLAWVQRMVPAGVGGLTLYAGRTLVDGQPYGLDLGVADESREVVCVDSIPFCGCDACDDGSDYLLGEFDTCVLTVARGGVVHARCGSDGATRRGDGWSGKASWLDATVVVKGVRRWVGEPWLGA